MTQIVPRPFRRVGVVNRGEPAVRFLRAARAWSARRGELLQVVAFYTHSDRDALFVHESDFAVALGEALVPGPDGKPTSAYLNIPRVIQLLKQAGCDAVWPGWGFVSERPEFVNACVEAGLLFIGPSAESMRLLGDKIAGKRMAEQQGVPVTDWSHGPVANAEEATVHANRIGYPVLLKAAAGGGGRGIRIVNAASEIPAAFASASNEARAAFGDATLLVESFAPEARHVEVQVFADTHGHVHAVGTRDCSLQRRHQKVMEEAPAPGLGELDGRIRAAAVSIARASGYTNAGTAEFLVLPDLSRFYFLEMNARLQVEHTVTECVTGLDFVGLQIDIARGDAIPDGLPETRGHAIEARLCAEDPDDNFRPSAGRLIRFDLPHGPGLRTDTGFRAGDAVAPEFDSMLAKIIAVGGTRDEAIARLSDALARTTILISGGASNRSLILELLRNEEVRRGPVTTRWLDRFLTQRKMETETLAATLAAAAIGEDLRARDVEIAEFMARAQRGLPRSAPTPETRTFRFSLRGAPISTEVLSTGPGQYRVSCDGESADVEYKTTGPGTAVLTMHGRRRMIVESPSADALHIEVDGVAHRLVRASDGKVLAPVPAAVTHVAVREGDKVKLGDRLCTLEVMKMEIAVKAPISGRISRLLVDGASRVTAGQPLIIIEAGASDHVEAAPKVVIRGLADPNAPKRQLVDILLDALLGYDLATATVKLELLRRGSLEIDREGVVKLIDAYIDHESLFDDGQESDGVSTVDHFARHLRQVRTGGDSHPDAFNTKLRKALAWHSVTDQDNEHDREGALLRIVQAHGASQTRESILAGALSALLRAVREDGGTEEHRHLRDRFESLAALVVDRNRELADLAYTALYLLCDRPRQLAEGLEMARAAREAFARIVRDGDEATAARAALDELPHGSLLALTGEALAADEKTRTALLDLLVRRLHPDVRSMAAIPGKAATYSTADGRVVAAIAKAGDAFDELSRAVLSMSPGESLWTLEADVFISEPTAAELTAIETGAGQLSERMPASVTRVSFNWGNIELGRLSRTFHRDTSGHFAETQAMRDLHPARVEAAEVERLSEFNVERLPAPGELFLAAIRAKHDPSDERLICIAEVERIDPERNEAGELVRIPSFERVFLTALHAMREAQTRRGRDKKLHWNRLIIFSRPVLDLTPEEIESMTRRHTPPTRGLNLEKVTIRGRVPGPDGKSTRPVAVEWTNPTGRGSLVSWTTPSSRPIRVLTVDERLAVEARRRGNFFPPELIRQLSESDGRSGFPPGSFVELDLDESGERLEPVDRPLGRNSANLVVGYITNRFGPFAQGLRRMLIVGDPKRDMGSLSEPECRRLLAAFELAERDDIAVEWVPVSSGARIAMDSGTENLDWTARVLARIVRFTQGGGTVNIIVDGLNVGAQSYWNAEATMLMHCRGALIMTPGGSMLLTGKKALEFAGSVSAADNSGIGGHERIMGPNGEAQYFAPDLSSAYRLLFRHLALTKAAPGEDYVRSLDTTDPVARDITRSRYPAEGEETWNTVGDIFDEATNPGRKKSFQIRPVMRAVLDADIEPLERWPGWHGAETAVVWEASLGGDAVCCIGIESRQVRRRGQLPADGPEQWTSGTLFPLSSKKVARAINAASGVRPVVVLANLSGFDGSPDSMRNLQLEYGAEIGRAVVNFKGTLLFSIISRYHGGAYVVFSQTLNAGLESFALEGSFASVIGGGPAAAVVFPGLARKRAEATPEVVAARKAVTAARPSERSTAVAEQTRVFKQALAHAQAQIAREFDGIHSVERAMKVGSLNAVIPSNLLRPHLISRIRVADGNAAAVRKISAELEARA